MASSLYIRRYRKRPIEIEAVRIMPHNIDLVVQWIRDGGGRVRTTPEFPECLWIATLEGPMEAAVGTYIIKGIAGEFYPCEPSIFAATYDEVD